MANKKVSELSPIATVSGSDLLLIVDISDNMSKKATVSQITSGVVAGSNTQIQFNSSGTLSASGNLTWTTATNTLGISGNLSVDSKFIVDGNGRLTKYNNVAPNDGEILVGDATDGYWKSSNLTAGSGVTITNGGGTIEISATGSGGTVTSVALDASTTGLTISGGSSQTITSSGTFTLGGTLAVANGGTGASSLTANNVLLGNGTSALQTVAPGASGNVLTSDGSTWVSQAPAGGGGGSTVDITITTTGLTAGDVCYISSNNTAAAANGTAIGTANVLGVVQTVAGAGSGKVRTQGIITANFVTSLALSAGQTAYLSKTAGKLTNNVSAFTTGNVYVPVGIITNVTTAGGGTGAADVAVNLDLIIVV